MQRAKAVGVDAFALNIGTDSFTDTQLDYAYTSAQNNGMKVFLSFDFNWWGIGSATAVGRKIAQYANHPAQLKVDNKVFVSTFVGDGVNVDTLRSEAGQPIYLAPNFRPSFGTSLANVESAFNWMGWPHNGNNRAPDSNTVSVAQGDQQYISALNGKDYMAPVSPWFFTHFGREVSYAKNWLFPGDLLWFDRWQQLLTLQPRFVEIVSWNDYGESHYVGPLSSSHSDDGASKWVNDMPHDGWLDMARPYIAAYKAGATSVANYITQDQLFYWYRPQPMTANCDSTDTCWQGPEGGDYYIGRPNGYQTVTDSVFVVALLRSAGTVQVTSGNNVRSFSASPGATSFTVPMGVGQQKFSLTQGGTTVLSGTSLKDIIDGCARFWPIYARLTSNDLLSKAISGYQYPRGIHIKHNTNYHNHNHDNHQCLYYHKSCYYKHNHHDYQDFVRINFNHFHHFAIKWYKHNNYDR
ncbi:hypothetical protein LTR05_007545 [Lithohypha guttulata]|uniref:Glycoside hydrolase family 71 protein n=1 Tax=Lithohypha guttulata TaxID=1690604 RepID=A0AAN7SVF5_9EURO|nr:hypothetical protein LTR05_007545 [Lithohypha guttulata]